MLGQDSMGRRPLKLAIRWVYPDPASSLTILPDESVLLGRDVSCQVQLPGTSISRQHAEIHREGRSHMLRDLGSRNGLFLNGKRTNQAILVPDHLIRLGEWIGVVIAVPIEQDDDPAPVFETFAEGLVGGPHLRAIVERARAAATYPVPMVLIGESGTEKDSLARAMHDWSGRQGPFIAVNCEALAPEQAEAEIFGFRRGVFRNAGGDHTGFMRAAQGGTLVLNEITALPDPVQAKLLRALQYQEILPVGEPVPVKIDVRVLATSEIPLDRAVARQRLRPDLRARLDGQTIQLPALRERKQDITFLFWNYLYGFTGGYPPAADTRLIERLCLHEWPYNVRELELLARRLWLQHGREDYLRCSYLPKAILQDMSTPAPPRGEPPRDRRSPRIASPVQRSRVIRNTRTSSTAPTPHPRIHCLTDTIGPTTDETPMVTRFGRE